MRRILPHTLTSILCLLFCGGISVSAFATTDPIQLDHEQGRYALSLSQSQQSVEICGLQAGSAYRVSYLSPDYPEAQFAFQLMGKSTSSALASDFILFTANDECQSLEIERLDASSADALEGYLSVVCQDCPVTSTPRPESNGGARNSIDVDQSFTPAELIQDIFIGGDCFDVTNVTAIGPPMGRGLFSNAEAVTGFGKGIILSTGDASDAVGPNNSGSTTGVQTPNANDADLAQLAGINVNNANGIEFDFIPTVDNLTFQFIFASEEYCEFVGFNDAFGFFVSGPGINGTFSNNAINIAQITGTTTNVGVSTVNQNVNSQFFIGNSASCGQTNAPDGIEYDGYTTIFTAEVDVQPCETYHIKLVIADASDQVYDSAVLLGAGTFDAGGEVSIQEVVPNSNDNIAIESCQDGQFHFTRNSIDLDQPLTLNFTMSPNSTATPGEDYVPFPTSITFAPNQQVFILDVDIIQDLITEGNESIIIEIDNDACSCLGQTAELIIEDYVPLEISPSTVTLCGPSGATIAPDIIGGAPLFSYSWNTGSSDPEITVGPATTTDYTVTITDACGESTSGTVTVDVLELPTATMTSATAICLGDPNPSATIEVSFTGTGPWDFTYSDGGTQTTITGVTDNPYSLTVNQIGTYFPVSVSNAFCDGTGIGAVDVELIDVEVTTLATDISCNSAGNGSIDLSVVSGDMPYGFQWSNSAQTEDIGGLGPDTYIVTVTDDNGCTETAQVTINEPAELIVDINEVAPILCNGDFGGTLSAVPQGGTPNYTYSWSNSSGSPSASQLPAGTYTVTIFDQNNCTNTATYILTEPDPIVSTIDLVQNVSCFDGSDGIANISSIGGTSPYFYNWSGGADPNNLEAGNYTVDVTDIYGCATTAAVFVTEPPPIILDATVLSNVDCNNPNGGEIDLLAVGGTPGYQYNWDNGAGNNEDPSGLDGGTYSVTVTDLNNCEAITSAEITADIDLPTAVAGVQGQLNCNNGSASLSGNGSSGTGSLSYEWFDPNGTSISDQSNTTVNDAGTYTLVVTTANGCTDESTVEVQEDVTAPQAVVDSNGDLTCIQTLVTLDGSNSTGANLQYSWEDQQGNTIGSGTSIDVNTDGDYTLIVTNTVNGCTSDASIAVQEDVTPPSAQASASDVLDCDVTSVNLDAVTGGANLNYEWEDNTGTSIGGGSQVGVNSPGNYTLIVTNTDNGCTATDQVQVQQDIATPIADILPPTDLDCTNTSSSLDGSGSSANGTIAYEWQDNGGNTIGGAATVDVSASGTYTLIITDTDNGCTASTTADIEQNADLPVPVATASNLLTCDFPESTLDASTSSGAGNLGYEWQDSGGQTISNDISFDVNTPDTYTLVITDADNGCSATTDVVLGQDIAEPMADAGNGTSLTCVDPEVTLDGSGSSSGANIAYEWTNAGGVVVGNDVLVDVTQTGTYDLVVTNTDNGCTAASSVTVTPDADLPVADAGSGATLTCTQTDANLDGSASSAGADIGYEWFDPQGNSLGGATTLTVNAIGTYTLVVSNTTNGCSASSSVEVDENLVAPQPVAADALLTCDATTVTLDGTGSIGNNLSYDWLDAGGNSLGGLATQDISISGNYTLEITDGQNGCTASIQVEVDEDTAEPTALPDADGILTCTNLSVNLDGSNSTGGTLTYEWEDVNGNSLGQSAMVTVSDPGDYNLIVTNTDNGCSATQAIIVNEDAIDPVADAGDDGAIDCINTSAILSGSNSSGGTLAFVWTDNNGNVVSNTFDLMTSQAGDYQLEVTNQDNGCTAIDVASVDAFTTPPTVDANASGLLTCADTEITLDGSNSAGSGTLTFEWLDENNQPIGSTSQQEVANTGTYTLQVTDNSNGCTASEVVLVFENVTPPTANAGTNPTLTCDQTSVTLDGSASSVGANIVYEWLNAGGVVVSNDQNPSVSEAGMYTLTVTNQDNGCTANSDVEVIPDANLPVANAGLESILTCANTEATLDGSASSAGASITYVWQDANGTPIANEITTDVATPGVYTLIVNDTDNGCTSSASVEIQENTEEPVADAGSLATLTCTTTSTLLDGSASQSSSGDLQYLWTDPNGTAISNEMSVEVAGAGTYTLEVTSDNGCNASSTVEVVSDTELPIADIGDGGMLDCAVTLIELGGGMTSVGPSINYAWTDADQNAIGSDVTLDVAQPGAYTLVVTNTVNECTAEAFVAIDQDIETPLADAGPLVTLNCTAPSAFVGGSGTSLGSDFVYSWTNSGGDLLGDETTVQVSTADTYMLLVTDITNSCTAEMSVDVDDNFDTPTADAGNGGILTCDVSTVSLNGGNSSGNNLAFAWLNEAGVEVSNDAAFDATEVGMYTLIVTNTESGCTSTSQAQITPDANLPTASVSVDGEITCVNNEVQLDGSNSSSISGNISYSWEDASGNEIATTSELPSMTPGLYTLIVTDTDNGCTASTVAEIIIDIVPPVVDVVEDQVLTCTETDVTLSGSGDGVNITLEWTDALGNVLGDTEDILVDLAGIYTLQATNNINGCVNAESVEVFLDENFPVAEAAVDGPLTCAINMVTLDIAGSATGTNISYQWQDANGNVLGDELIQEVSTAGAYTLLVTDADNGCVSQALVDVPEDIADPEAIITANITALDCNNTSTSLDGIASSSANGQPIEFLWSTSDGQIISGTNLSFADVDAVGTYQLLITDAVNGCTATETYTLDGNYDVPNVSIALPVELNCDITDQTLNANVSPNGDYVYNWQSSTAGGIVSDGNTTLPLIDEPGTYTIIVTNNENGCTTEASTNVDQNVQTPVAVVNAEAAFSCINESVGINGNGSDTGPNFVYSWTGAGDIADPGNLATTVFAAGDYTLQVTNLLNGCSQTALLTVEESEGAPTAADVAINQPECVDDAGSLGVLTITGGTGPYVYSLDGGESYSAQSFYNNLSPGNYDLLVQDAIGCEYEQSFTIDAPIEVSVELETEVELRLGETHQLDANINIPLSDVASVIWSPATGLDCTDCLDPIASIDQTTTYTVTVINNNGCIATDQILLRMNKKRNVFIPNAFTPGNADGNNDKFIVFAEGDQVLQINTFRVFDRWGALMFEQYNFQPNDPLYGWDGFHRGEPLNPGVFVYVVEVSFIDGVVELYKGDVTITD